MTNATGCSCKRRVNGYVVVDRLGVLPPPDGAGVILLAPHTAYYFTAFIDLLGSRLQLSDSSVLLGTSSETGAITSTGLAPGVALITAQHGGPTPVQNLLVHDVDTAFDIDGLGGSNAALDWSAFNLENVPNIGSIRNFSNLVINDSAWINSAKLEIDGSVGTVSFFQTIWTVAANLVGLRFLATCVVARRFRWAFSPMVVPGGATGILVDDRSLCFPNAESLGVLHGNFSGAGSYLVGASYADDKTNIESSFGIVNSSSLAHYYQVGGATPTVIAIAGTFYKVAGSPVAGSYISKFVVSGNRATYIGSEQRFFRLSASVTLSSGANDAIAIRFALNNGTLADTEQRTTTNAGGRVESMSTLGVALLSPGDFLELFATNLSGPRNVTVTDMQVVYDSISQ